MKKCKALNSSNEWVYGYPVPSSSGNTVLMYTFIDICEDYDDDEVGAVAPYDTVKRDSICEYILTDQNGNEVFNGDEVNFFDWDSVSENECLNTGFIEWDEDSIGFSVTNRWSVEMSEIDYSKVTATGRNIHDNDQ